MLALSQRTCISLPGTCLGSGNGMATTSTPNTCRAAVCRATLESRTTPSPQPHVVWAPVAANAMWRSLLARGWRRGGPGSRGGSGSGHPPSMAQRALEMNGGSSSQDNSLNDYLEVKVESVRVLPGASVVYLRVLDSEGLVFPVHIGETESNALLQELNKQRQARPLTHDLTRSMLQAIGFRVTKIRINDIIQNTYYARIHIGQTANGGGDKDREVEVDARPSDAINLAIRFQAPMYINKKLADKILPPTIDSFHHTQPETHNEIVRSVRETLASFEDPTIMFQLQKELAIKEERFEDANVLQQHIYHEMTHNKMLRIVVAMEAALADGRYDESAKLRDEYKKMMQEIREKCSQDSH